MSGGLYLTFVVTEAILCVTPGPAVLLVISQALHGSMRASVWGMIGILVANALYFALSALGLGAALLAATWLFALVKWGGVVYLAYVGLSMLWGASEAGPGADAPRPQGYFRQGLVLQLSNPKAIIFFVALLPQFIAPEANVAAQMALLGATSIAIETIVLLVYGWAASSARRLVRDEHRVLLQQRVAGACLLIVAAGLAVASAV
jgi:homoserine/homoserine lactone efflux protein